MKLSSLRLSQDLLAKAKAGLPPNVLALHVLMAAQSDCQAREVLHDMEFRCREPRVRAGVLAASALIESTPQAFETVKRTLAHVDNLAADDSHKDLRAWAHVFDRLAEESPDPAVALYTLGRADLLKQATASIVARLRAWTLIGPGIRVLDYGCGTGRLAPGIVAAGSQYTGLDISGGMIAHARVRHRTTPAASFNCIDPHGPLNVQTESFDTVLAIDVFPYVADTSDIAAAALFASLGRTLRPGGQLLVANLTYSHPLQSATDMGRRVSAAAGLHLVRVAQHDFDFWDGTTFHFLKERRHGARAGAGA